MLRRDSGSRSGCYRGRTLGINQSLKSVKGQQSADYHSPPSLGQRGSPHKMRGRRVQKHRGIPGRHAHQCGESLTDEGIVGKVVVCGFICILLGS